jgi:hypothetical protein
VSPSRPPPPLLCERVSLPFVSIPEPSPFAIEMPLRLTVTCEETVKIEKVEDVPRLRLTVSLPAPGPLIAR